LGLRFIATLLTLPLAAHVLFVMPSSFHVTEGERILVGLHNGDLFPDSEGSLALERFRDVTVHTGRLQYNVTNLRVDGGRVVGDARIPAKGTLVIGARTLPKFVALDSEAFEVYLKSEGMAQVIQLRQERGESGKPGRELHSKYLKALVRAGSGAGDHAYAKPVGFAIEFVPEEDPYSMKVGDTMPVRLLWKGKPASGVLVEAARAGASGPAEGYSVGRTDSEGRVHVPLSAAGKWRLHAVAIERCGDERQADWESFWASLTFEMR
jgi:hypothetical protein